MGTNRFKNIYDHYSRLFLSSYNYLFYISSLGEVYKIAVAKKGNHQKYTKRIPLETYFNTDGYKCIKIFGIEYRIKELSVNKFSWDKYNPSIHKIINIDGDENNCCITNLKIVRKD